MSQPYATVSFATAYQTPPLSALRKIANIDTVIITNDVGFGFRFSGILGMAYSPS